MDFLSDTNQFIKVLLIILVIILIIHFSKKYSEGMTTTLQYNDLPQKVEEPVKAEEPVGVVPNYQRVTDEDLLSSPYAFTENKDFNPSDLLPLEAKGEIGGASDFDSKNFLVAGYPMGINTQGNSNKNGNLQLRSDPIIPSNPNAFGMMQTSRLPDTFRAQFEIGSSC